MSALAVVGLGIAYFAICVILGALLAHLLIFIREGEPWKPFLTKQAKREKMLSLEFLVYEGVYNPLEAYDEFKKFCGQGFASECHNLFAPWGPCWIEPIDRFFDADMRRFNEKVAKYERGF